MVELDRTAVTIRLALEADLPAATAIMIRTFERDFGTGYMPEIHTDIADMRAAYLDDPGSALFVAVDDATSDVIGTAGVKDGALKPGLSPTDLVRRYADGRTAQLVRVYTLAEHRRRGIARRLVLACLDWILAQPSFDRIALHTYPHSPGALGFWASMGTVTVADDRDGPSQAIFFEIPVDAARTMVAAG